MTLGHRRGAGIVAAVISLGLAAGMACAPAVWPRVLSTSELRRGPTPVGEWITDYDSALATIVAIMRRDLGLPIGDAALVFYRDRDSFREALLESGYDDQLAVDVAQSLIAVGGPRRVLLNEAGLRALEWPFRVGVLAHELMHTLQYELANGQRGTSEQWLREGVAEWVEVEVLVALGFTTRERARDIALRQVRGVTLPPLQALVTFPDWVRAGLTVGTGAIYAEATLAATRLIERHGAPAALSYFQRFAESNDRLANFRQAFGQDLDAFDRAFHNDLAAGVR